MPRHTHRLLYLVLLCLILLGLTLQSLILVGCSDDNTVVQPSANAIDTAPPSVPTGLTAALTKPQAHPHAMTHVKVGWDPNVVDDDFAGFMVYRIVWGERHAMLDLPIRDSFWVDTHPVDVACTYAVTSFDQSGNESAWVAVNFLGFPEAPQIHRD